MTLNLQRETCGSTAIMTESGTLEYPILMSYDMGWQKSARSFDSLSGVGTCIGWRTGSPIRNTIYQKKCVHCENARKRGLQYAQPHTCAQNYEGSSKGMESKAALDCCLRIRQITISYGFVNICHVAIVTLDDDASTRAILSHSYKELIDAGKMETWPLTAKGNRKSDSGKLPLDHPEIIFFSDLCHRVRSFGKYLYVEERKAKKDSTMTKVDCLRLKRNFAWWLFTSRHDTLEEFKNAGMAVVEHHFNNHQYCGEWCPHQCKNDA